MKLIDIFLLLRPHQWYKNLVIFIGLIFSINLQDTSSILISLESFVIFCLLSGSVYAMNDVVDADKDRNHPEKCNRPIASGRMSISTGLVISLLIMFLSLYLSFRINYEFGIASFCYVLFNLAYSLYLKSIAILDILIIASLFSLRAIAGSLSLRVEVSPWLILCAFLIALFLVLNKRKSELLLQNQTNSNFRSVLTDYSLENVKLNFCKVWSYA